MCKEKRLALIPVVDYLLTDLSFASQVKLSVEISFSLPPVGLEPD